MSKPYDWAVVFGKFMPPHSGHDYLISLAAGLAKKTSVFVAHPFHPNPEMPSTLRARWLQQHFGPSIDFHCPPEGARDEVSVTEAIRRGRAYFDEVRGERMPDVIVGADNHIRFFARLMGIKAIVPDAILSIRATKIRENPLAHWNDILPPAKPYFLKEAIFIGPKSALRRVGKSARSKGIAHLPLEGLAPAHVPASLDAIRKVASRRLVITVSTDLVDEPWIRLLDSGAKHPGSRSVYIIGNAPPAGPALLDLEPVALDDAEVEATVAALTLYG